MLSTKHIHKGSPKVLKRKRSRTQAWNSRPITLSLWKRRWLEKHP